MSAKEPYIFEYIALSNIIEEESARALDLGREHGRELERESKGERYRRRARAYERASTPQRERAREQETEKPSGKSGNVCVSKRARATER